MISTRARTRPPLEMPASFLFPRFLSITARLRCCLLFFSSEFLQIALCNFIGLSFEQIYRYARSREKGAGLSIVEFIDYTDSAKVSRSVLGFETERNRFGSSVFNPLRFPSSRANKTRLNNCLEQAGWLISPFRAEIERVWRRRSSLIDRFSASLSI